MTAVIPDKLYFKIGEVSELAGLRPSVLRYWETEFPGLVPQKSRSGQRLYTRKHVDLVIEIRDLLYREKLTIEGARRRLGGRRVAEKGVAQEEGEGARALELLREIREELLRMRDSL